MLKFNYKGRTKTGKLISGYVENITKEAAINLLRQKGIIVTSIEVVTTQQDVINKIEEFLHINKVKVTDLILFCRQMYSLSRSGVPIVSAIKSVAGNVENSRFQSALDNIVNSLESGTSLHAAMSKYPKIFPSVLLALVEVGESSGNLDAIFAQLASHFEREAKTARQITSALRYPIFVVIALCIAITVVNIMVIPAFAAFFEKFNAELPLPTKILIGISDFMVENGYLIALSIIGLIIWWIMFIGSKPGRLFWDSKKLKIPLVGSIIYKGVLARFSRTFSLTSSAGVPLLDGIQLSANATDNAFVNKKITTMKNQIERGDNLTSAARKTKLFSSLVMQMIIIGEETGEIDKLLAEVATFYEEEIDYELEKLSSAIEPILIFVIAGMVLILALGIFLPMWDISSAAL